MEEFGVGLRFQKVIEDHSDFLVADEKIRKVIFCSGQVYYNLEEERTKRGAKDIAIVRVEQLAPFPFRTIGRCLDRYPNAELMWTQEEPKNQGAYSFVEPRMRNLLKARKAKN